MKHWTSRLFSSRMWRTAFTLILGLCLGVLLFAGCSSENIDEASASPDSPVSASAPAPPGSNASRPVAAAQPNSADAAVSATRAFPAAAAAEQPGEWQDLLPLIDPAAHAAAGQWSRQSGELTVAAQPGARLQLPWQPPREYDLDVEFTRRTGRDSIALIFVAGEAQASFELDGWGQQLAGIQNIGGQSIRENTTTVRDQPLMNGQRYRVLLQVRRAGVQVLLDGRPFTFWQGNADELSLLDVWQLPGKTSLGLGAWASDTTFHTVRVRPVQATGGESQLLATTGNSPATADSAAGGLESSGVQAAGQRATGSADLPASQAESRPAAAPSVKPVRTAAREEPADRGESESGLAAQLVADETGFDQLVQPFLQQHCARCHGMKRAEGEFRVDTHLLNSFAERSVREKWGEVLNVLNSHEMPPEGEPQPATKEVARIVDWITGQVTRAELISRDSAIVLRRLNRAEYRNTIHELTGVDFDPAGFPQDPPAGGFDNNGGALTLSPLQMELYYDAARTILNEALVEGSRPPVLRWRFEPESGDSDSNRVVYDGQRVIVNGGKNRTEGGFRVLHHPSWDRTLQARDFALPHAGEYIIRVRASGRVPDRAAVVASARNYINQRMNAEIQKNPAGERYIRERYDRDLKHFQTDRMYDYGPPRLKLSINLSGRPQNVAEFDVPAPENQPAVYEFRTTFNTYRAGIRLEYAYQIPREVENAWLQTGDEFARPEALVDWIELEGPVYESWPPPGHRKLMAGVNPRARNEQAAAREVIANFLRRAWRRPVTDDEIEAKLTLFETVRPQSSSFIEAIRAPLTAALVSPHFLYLAEPVATAEQRAERTAAPGQSSTATSSTSEEQQAGAPALRQLTDHQLAARLSYFLWSSMPDDELSERADRGQLQHEGELRNQLGRMLDDPRSDRLIENFAGQWLSLREVGSNPPAEDLYPRYDRHLEVSIVEESLAFFEEILRNDLDAMNLIQSDYVVTNERLARFYGIPGVRGDHFRRVPVPAGTSRGGVLTQAAVLSVTSNGTRTSPVKRGTWILKNILGSDPGLPVANAGEIAPQVPGIDKATVRRRLEIHRQLPQCARCHNRIDPLGFALENFNAAGEWREREGFGYKGRIGPNDPLIDASSRLPDGTRIDGIAGLQQALLERDDEFLGCLAGKMMTYALGRETGIADRQYVQAAVAHMQQNGRTLRSLLEYVVTSEPFRTK